MSIAVFRVLVAVTGLFLLDLLLYGFVLGFGVFLALCVVSALLLWSYHRLVISRNQQLLNWRWEQFGSAIYRMEVA